MVKTRKASRPLPITQNMGFSKTFLFSKTTFWKKKILTPLVNYSIFYCDYIQDKRKYSTQYNYLILQLEYFFLTSFTMTQTYMHTSWIS